MSALAVVRQAAESQIKIGRGNPDDQVAVQGAALARLVLTMMQDIGANGHVAACGVTEYKSCDCAVQAIERCALEIKKGK